MKVSKIEMRRTDSETSYAVVWDLRKQYIGVDVVS
jgi:hypothetical protein